MKNFWNGLKESCKKNKIEILLMCLFICAVLVLNREEIAREAALLFGTVETSGEAVIESESEDASENAEQESDEEADTDAEEEADSASDSDDGADADEVSEDGEDADAVQGSADGESAEDANENSNAGEDADAEIESGDEANSEAESESGDGEDAEQTAALAPGSAAELQTEPETEVLVYHDLSDTLEIEEYDLPKIQSMALLERVIENRISKYDGEWSVYVKNLSTDQSFTVNDVPMKSASVMKLFIMGTVYKAFESGDLERTDEVMSLMKDMIIYSGNDSSNSLLYKLGGSDYKKGIAKVDEFIQEYGFSDMTMEYNGFNNSSLTFDTENYNQVAAKDCGKLLEDIYRRTWVNREVSNEIESMLLNQNTRYKIPAGLPDGVLCGNKSGEMNTTENDAAIIYGEDCDYILVVLSSDWGSKDKAISRIRDISSVVYDFLND